MRALVQVRTATSATLPVVLSSLDRTRYCLDSLDSRRVYYCSCWLKRRTAVVLRLCAGSLADDDIGQPENSRNPRLRSLVFPDPLKALLLIPNLTVYRLGPGLQL